MMAQIQWLILSFYVIGAIFFVIAPVYRLFDKITPNVYYIEIAGTGQFVISNALLLRQQIINRRPLKIYLFLSFFLGAATFLSASAYRIHDEKTLVNVYIDLSASLIFLLSTTVDLGSYISKSCRGKHSISGKYIYKYLLRIMYILGSLIFLTASIYRIVVDYLSQNSLYIDIVAISMFLIPNSLMFGNLVRKTLTRVEKVNKETPSRTTMDK